jgi:hypothetical protein
VATAARVEVAAADGAVGARAEAATAQEVEGSVVAAVRAQVKEAAEGGVNTAATEVATVAGMIHEGSRFYYSGVPPA